jgi:hypothetical protein
VARKGESGICLKCGADVPLPEGEDVVGARLAGGPPNPEALAKPARSGGGSRRGSGGRGGAGSRGGRGGRGSGSRTTRRTRQTESAPDA